MKPQPTKKDSNIHILHDKVIYIVSHNRFQSELLLFYLLHETGADCHMADDITDIPHEKSPQNILFLIECPGTDIEHCLNELPICIKDQLFNYPVALFNVTQGHGIENKAVSKGVKGIFYAQDPLPRFQKGVSAIFEGELWVSREILTKYVIESREKDKNDIQDNILTQREIQILAMISTGAKNEEIADKLFISPNTVKTHAYNIFKKIDVPNRLQAALWAAKNL